MNISILGLVITCSILVIVNVVIIYENNKIKRKFKKDVKELKVGNRYKMKKFRWVDDNPFNIEPTYTCIVEITDIKFNNKGERYVQYRQIDPKYEGEPFSDPFDEFIEFYELIK